MIFCVEEVNIPASFLSKIGSAVVSEVGSAANSL